MGVLSKSCVFSKLDLKDCPACGQSLNDSLVCCRCNFTFCSSSRHGLYWVKVWCGCLVYCKCSNVGHVEFKDALRHSQSCKGSCPSGSYSLCEKNCPCCGRAKWKKGSNYLCFGCGHLDIVLPAVNDSDSVLLQLAEQINSRQAVVNLEAYGAWLQELMQQLPALLQLPPGPDQKIRHSLWALQVRSLLYQ